MPKTSKAKIFISCGQDKNTDEVGIARRIAECLEKKEFDPYIATEQQTLRGLKENIFEEISSSEYFLFIDFKREKLNNSDICRGSLFSHQELAVASFLDIPVVAFQECGAKFDDGILKILQANCTPFTDRNTLADLVVDKVTSAGWKSGWKNQLILERDSSCQYEDAFRLPEKKNARFFHITVRNLNPYKHARNCYAFLERVYNSNKKELIPTRSIEFKWAGYTLPNATILPGSSRYIDGFYVFHDLPTTPLFNLFADSSYFIPRIKGPGDYDLTYLVVSDNFRVVRSQFKLHLSDKLGDIVFEQIRDTEK